MTSVCCNSIVIIGIEIPKEIFEQYRENIFKLQYYVSYSNGNYYVGQKYLDYELNNSSYYLPNFSKMEKDFISLNIHYTEYPYMINQIYKPKIHFIKIVEIDRN